MTYSFYGKVVKPVIDWIFILFSAPFWCPLAGLIAISVIVLMGLPVLFRQQRPGLHGKPFTTYKFRTMTDVRDVQGNVLPDKERLTSLGRFLRSTSLDELPELFNVLRGEMSLVGPRPLVIQYLSRYSTKQARRHDVLPGITGWAQVHGRNALAWVEKFRFDVWYVDHRSLSLDLQILGLTVIRVLAGEGINQPGQATMEEFMGNGTSGG